MHESFSFRLSFFEGFVNAGAGLIGLRVLLLLPLHRDFISCFCYGHRCLCCILRESMRYSVGDGMLV